MSKWRDITALQIRFIWKLGVDNYCYPASTRATSCATDLEVGGGRRAVTATSGMLCHSCSFPSLHTDDRRGSDRCRGRAEQVLSVIHSLTPPLWATHTLWYTTTVTTERKRCVCFCDRERRKRPRKMGERRSVRDERYGCNKQPGIILLKEKDNNWSSL